MNLKKTAAYYDSHWRNFADLNYPNVKIDKVKNFFLPVIDEITKSSNLLDVGCGDGVHYYYLRKIAGKSVSYYGIDISGEAVAVLSEKLTLSRGHFEVMDACDLKFPDNHFDLVFAYGVIGYTDQPKQAFSEMVRVCKKGGWVGVFSPEIGGMSKPILQTIRALFARLGSQGKRILADLLLPFFGLAPSETQISLWNASKEQVREVILTDIAPPKLEILSHEEIENWAHQKGIEIKFDNPDQRTIIWGRKK